MHNKALVFGLILFVLSMHALGQTEKETEQATQVPDYKTENAEYARRKLPADTFKPSEEISEDYPVPFPVDI